MLQYSALIKYQIDDLTTLTVKVYIFRAQFHNTLIWFKFNPINHAKLYIFQTMVSGMFKAEYIVYL